MCACSAVEILVRRHSGGQGIEMNLRGEINFVGGFADAGAQLHDHILSPGSELLAHGNEGHFDDAKLRAHLSRVQQSDGLMAWID